jgi:apolipoprotein D and lipocalin family protein
MSLDRITTLAALCGTVGLVGLGCGTRLPPPRTVAQVDLDRYLGRWYEIAHLPFRVQRGCHGTTATYSRNPDGTIRVVNRCRDGSLTGKERTAVGKAWVVDPQTRAKLKVQFFWPFRGDYWVLALGPDYDWALVGTPSRRYLWILSRTPTLPQATLDQIRHLAAAQGYDTMRLLRTPQDAR